MEKNNVTRLLHKMVLDGYFREMLVYIRDNPHFSQYHGVINMGQAVNMIAQDHECTDRKGALVPLKAFHTVRFFDRRERITVNKKL